jgi:alpha-L-rhamnosidase
VDLAFVAAPVDLRFEHRTDGPDVIGVGRPAPRLSWIVPAAHDSFRQDAYEVEVNPSSAELSTARVDSGEQVLVPWPAAPLRSRERATVRVRVRGGDSWSAWSAPATVEAGLLEPADWVARFISPRNLGSIGASAPYVSSTLHIPGPIANARLYITAHGLYEATLNGRRVGDQVLTPGWTSYQHRLRYQTYDVTDLVREGGNDVAVLLGNGWYRGRLGWGGRRAVYGDQLALLAQLEVTTVDGNVHVLATDESWSAHNSGILADDLYDGQRTDCRIGSDGTTDKVELVDADLARLVAPEGPPVRVTETLPAARVFTSPSGATLVDFGQNLVGWVRLRIRNQKPGAEVVLRHAEVLEHGELGVRPLRTAQATDSFLVAGGELEVLEPRFTFHGFRYVEVRGVPDLSADDLEAVVVGSDLTRTGWFESSHQLLNRFHENVVWGMRGNFVDVPTDCPQRDERLGWTGDIQVFSPTATFLFDSAGFLGSWLADLAADQYDDGTVPYVIPDALGHPQSAAAAWGDAATLVPWVLYQRTGDVDVLARQLSSMRAWVDKMAALAGPDRRWIGGFQFGDWLDPTAPPDNPFQAKADPDVIATAHLARSAEIVGQAAQLIGEAEVSRRYLDLADEVRAAFVAEYVTAGGVLSDSPTAYALALSWDLLPDDEQRRRAGERLADLVRSAGFRISTGFVGTPLIADALTESGHPDVAYRLLLQTDVPSWLYAVQMGATTVWERWDSMLPDGSINPGQMTSFNHYALGAVADWLHRTVAGLAPAAPGYREIVVRPIPHDSLTSASARHRTPYGIAESSWQRADGQLTLRVVVPVGAAATVHVPGRPTPVVVDAGEHQWQVADPCSASDELPSDATVRDLLDSLPAWRRVTAACTETGVFADDAQVAARLARHLDDPAEDLPAILTMFGQAPHGDVLRQRLEALALRS